MRQGGEGGGHTGDVGSVVLWPEVIDAIAPTCRCWQPAASATGGQMAAAMAMGAAGVWTGSLWLTVEEADIPPAQMESYLDAPQPRHRSLAVLHRQAVPHAAATTGPRRGRPTTHPNRSACRCRFMVAIEAVTRGHATPSRPWT